MSNQTYFFSVNHITKESNTKLIYGICLNNHTYFLSKSRGTNDGEQLDNNPLLSAYLLNQICQVITEIEMENTQRPSLEFMNIAILRILARIRSVI